MPPSRCAGPRSCCFPVLCGPPSTARHRRSANPSGSRRRSRTSCPPGPLLPATANDDWATCESGASTSKTTKCSSTRSIRLSALLPQEGLIIDLRDNPGGLIWAAERMLQLLTPNTITPTQVRLVATPLTRAMAQSPVQPSWSSSPGSRRSRPPSPPARSTRSRFPSPIPHGATTRPALQRSGGLRRRRQHLFVGRSLHRRIRRQRHRSRHVVGEATGAGGANVWTDSRHP